MNYEMTEGSEMDERLFALARSALFALDWCPGTAIEEIASDEEAFKDVVELTKNLAQQFSVDTSSMDEDDWFGVIAAVCGTHAS